MIALDQQTMTPDTVTKPELQPARAAGKGKAEVAHRRKLV
jgi:hypothetical protein